MGRRTSKKPKRCHNIVDNDTTLTEPRKENRGNYDFHGDLLTQTRLEDLEKHAEEIEQEIEGINRKAIVINEDERVPAIQDPAEPQTKKTKCFRNESYKFIAKQLNEGALSVEFKREKYESMCIKELADCNFKFITIQPGLFVLALGLTYEDDFHIINTIYATDDSKPQTFCQEVFWIEKCILQHIENFNTLAICNIFNAIITNSITESRVITEMLYLLAVNEIFDMAIPFQQSKKYRHDDVKTKFCPERNIRIHSLYQDQHFE
ncbi:hypothetical protein HHI36_010951 [Cryptolaemus montrouzieri]|uniref:Uncharacterized protein n=1 Tax=Cryptolaemus montrouzieri TaxID=559131 RepID=A0ABD2MKA7_9CUCU